VVDPEQLAGEPAAQEAAGSGPIPNGADEHEATERREGDGHDDSSLPASDDGLASKPPGE